MRWIFHLWRTSWTFFFSIFFCLFDWLSGSNQFNTSRLPCYVFCICLLTNRYQKYKSVELADQQEHCIVRFPNWLDKWRLGNLTGFCIIGAGRLFHCNNFSSFLATSTSVWGWRWGVKDRFHNVLKQPFLYRMASLNTWFRKTFSSPMPITKFFCEFPY